MFKYIGIAFCLLVEAVVLFFMFKLGCSALTASDTFTNVAGVFVMFIGLVVLIVTGTLIWKQVSKYLVQ